MPPLVNIPLPVTDLAALQRGNRIIVQFTPPAKTTEGMPMKAPQLDLRIGAGSGADWERDAKPVPAPAPASATVVRYEIPIAEWTGRNVTIGARTSVRTNKYSAWSNFVTMEVVPAPPAPELAEPEATAKGIRLTWQGPGGDFRVFRREEKEKTFTPQALVSANEWVDPAAEYGTPYTYMVQRIVKLQDREAESELSQERTITAKDTFAPEPPSGISASSSPNSIELSWEGNAEPDIAGYRVYRAAPGAEFEKLAETPPVPHYSDAAAEPGKTYRYQITAFDRTGNESSRSAAAEATR
jgi:hypothetical protein